MKTKKEYKNNIQLILNICICIIFVICLSVSAYIGYRLVQHEKKQTARIKNLERRVSELSSERQVAHEDDIDWLDDGFNYLAIGNSITIHGISSYWWNEVGMAASDAEHDYFHIVTSYLREKNRECKGIPCAFAVWETQSHDRDETLPYLDQYLSPKLDLITIQLGENANNLSTYEEDYKSLINYIKDRAPNARILVIGDFWTLENRNDLKTKAVSSTNVEFVSLKGISDNRYYYCGLGTIVLGADGKEHTVDHEGVAIHPSDKGMRAIADRIIAVL